MEQDQLNKFIAQLKILIDAADEQYKKEHSKWIKDQNTGDGFIQFPDIAFTRKNTLHEIMSMYELYENGEW